VADLLPGRAGRARADSSVPVAHSVARLRAFGRGGGPGSARLLLLRATHNLAEGAGAAGLAGLIKLRDTLAGQSVAVVLSGSNIDASTLRRVLAGEL